MKKTKFAGISLLGTLLLFSFVDMSLAQPSYVGVKTGDTYTWAVTDYIDEFNDSYSYIYEILDGLLNVITGYNISEWIGSAYRVKITNMTDEMLTWGGIPGVGIYTNIYVKTDTTSWSLVHSDSWPSSPMMWIYNPVNLNETNWDWYFPFFRPYFTPAVFIPLGIDFTQVAPYLANNLVSKYPFFPANTTVVALPVPPDGSSLGLEFTISGPYLDYLRGVSPGTSLYVELTMSWWSTEIGISSGISYRYGHRSEGLLFKMRFASEGGGIPGYALSIILGIGAVGIVSLIYVIRSKDRLE